MAAVARRALKPGLEWEFDQHVLPRDASRSFVTRYLVDLAETGGWELARHAIGNDGVRRIVVKRKIIRQQRPLFYVV
ncbi:hypothetical protein GCM10011584_26640 [Nocardioides phosphati]|uniref:Uncharacterized protein n=1 Tax=Nocardioides phosphati TaxID=1867775 RepID=A0ABQ2NCV3_9ACTN|nr:DUF5703 family protein [Nocardioides phosphati]GGO91770.1 hypothetical protein GCM10011584_26640 [Nocardioides phosphati]